MDLDNAADQLSGLPPEEFIAARNQLAKQAERVDAARIKELRKPTAAAWLANQLVRRHRPEIGGLLALGEDLRTATAAMDGDRLRQLTPQRHRLVDGLVGQARELAERAGKQVSPDVARKLAETLDAALIDPAAAAAVTGGRLASALRHVGFGLVDESGEPSNVVSIAHARAARVPAGEGRTAAARKERQRAEKAAAAAEAEAERAAERSDELAAELDRRRGLVKQAQAAVERLAAELEDARDAVAHARTEVRRLTDELEEARRDARAALRRSREAQLDLD